MNSKDKRKVIKEKKKTLSRVEKELIRRIEPQLEDGIIDVSKELDWQSGIFVDQELFNRIYENMQVMELEDEVEIRVHPSVDKDHFNRCLDNTVAKILIITKQKERVTMRTSLLMFIMGLALTILSALKTIDHIFLVEETIMIASWVFMWGAAENFFFEKPSLVYKKYKLIRICEAEIIH